MGYEAKEWLSGETIQADHLNNIEKGLEEAAGPIVATRLPDATATTRGAVTGLDVAASRVTAGFTTGTYNGSRYSLLRTFGGKPTPGLVSKEFGGGVVPGIGAACVPTRETLASISQRVGATAAFNASGWKISGNVGEMRGAQIHAGKILHDFETFSSSPAGVDAIGFRADGSCRTYTARRGDTAEGMVADGVVTSFSYGPILVRDGGVEDLSDANWAYFLTEKSARQIIGVNALGEVMVATIEGKTDAGIGLTAPQAAEWAATLGFHHAILGDGGGSAQAQAGDLQVVASSDASGARPVVDALCVDATLINQALPTTLKPDPVLTPAPVWADVSVNEGFAANQGKVPQLIRDRTTVYARRGFSNAGMTAAGSFIVGTVPAGYRPTEDKYMVLTGSSAASVAQAVIAANGNITIRTSGTLSPYYMLDALSWTLL